MRRLLIVAVFLVGSQPAIAEEVSPLFGSSTASPVRIAVDPVTGKPFTVASLPDDAAPAGN